MKIRSGNLAVNVENSNKNLSVLRTEPSLTFDLLCRLTLMLDEAKLSATSISICTTNRMSGEALSNKCFIMLTALSDHKRSHFYG